MKKIQQVKLDSKVISHSLKNSLTAALRMWNFMHDLRQTLRIPYELPEKAYDRYKF